VTRKPIKPLDDWHSACLHRRPVFSSTMMARLASRDTSMYRVGQKVSRTLLSIRQILTDFHNFFHQHILWKIIRCGGIFGNPLLQIFRRICRWKNFENRSIFGKDMDKSVRRTFLAHLLSCGGIFSNRFTANFPQNVPLKSFQKSVNIWRRCGQKFAAYFLWPTP